MSYYDDDDDAAASNLITVKLMCLASLSTLQVARLLLDYLHLGPVRDLPCLLFLVPQCPFLFENSEGSAGFLPILFLVSFIPLFLKPLLWSTIFVSLPLRFSLTFYWLCSQNLHFAFTKIKREMGSVEKKVVYLLALQFSLL